MNNTIVAIGVSGSGKGTQVNLLREKIQTLYSKNKIFHHHSGEKLSGFLKKQEYSSTLVSQRLQNYSLAPDYIMNWLFVTDVIHNFSPSKNFSFLCDGFPRTLNQANTFESVMETYKRESVDVLHLTINFEEAKKRMLLRGRDDDKDEALIAERISWYQKYTFPILEYFDSKSRYNVIHIDAIGSPHEVQERINKSLHLV